MSRTKDFPVSYRLNDLSNDNTTDALHREGSVILAKDKGVDMSDAKIYARVPYEDIEGILSHDQNIYENISDNLARRFIIDLDAEDEYITNIKKQTEKQFIKSIFAFVRYLLFDKLKLDIQYNKDDVIILSGTRPGKISIHMIFPFGFINHEQQLIFKHHLFILLLSPVAKLKQHSEILTRTDGKCFVDSTVYKKNQLFRAINQSKFGKSTKLKFVTNEVSIKETLVGIYESTTIPLIELAPISDTKKKSTELKAIINEAVESVYEVKPIEEYDMDKFSNEYEFLVMNIPNNNVQPQSQGIWYRIGMSLKGAVADKLLSNADALDLWIRWSNQANKRYPNEDAVCRRKWIDIEAREISVLVNIFKQYYDKSVWSKFQAIHNRKKLFDLQLQNFKIFEYSGIHCEKLFPYTDLYKYIVQHSKTGTGKTYAICMMLIQLIKTYSLKSMIAVTIRQAFARSFTADVNKRVKDINQVCYLDVKEPDTFIDEFLTVQYESLYKVKNNYQVIILDELDSLISQMVSETLVSKNLDRTLLCFEKMFTLILNAKIVICADAIITQKSIAFLDMCLAREKEVIKSKRAENYIEVARKLRDLVHGKQTSMDQYINVASAIDDEDKLKREESAIILRNDYGNTNQVIAKRLGVFGAKDITQYKEKFIHKIIGKLNQGKNVYVFSGSKDFAKEIYASVINIVDKSKVELYSSETDDEDFKNDLSDINSAWITKRVVISTTKITAGVDFSVGIQKDGEDLPPPHFHNIFVYASNCSATAGQVFQASRRVRYLVDNEIYYMIYQSHDNWKYHDFSIETLKRLTSIVNVDHLKIINLCEQECRNSKFNFQYEWESLLAMANMKIEDESCELDTNIVSGLISRIPVSEEEFKQILSTMKFEGDNISEEQEKELQTNNRETLSTKQKITREVKTIINKARRYCIITKQEVNAESIERNFNSYYIDFKFQTLLENTLLERSMNASKYNVKINVANSKADIAIAISNALETDFLTEPVEFNKEKLLEIGDTIYCPNNYRITRNLFNLEFKSADPLKQAYYVVNSIIKEWSGGLFSLEKKQVKYERKGDTRIRIYNYIIKEKE